MIVICYCGCHLRLCWSLVVFGLVCLTVLFFVIVCFSDLSLRVDLWCSCCDLGVCVLYCCLLFVVVISCLRWL